MSIMDEIEELKKKTDSVILAHYYVDGLVQEVADYVGDSYFLAKKAKKVYGVEIIKEAIDDAKINAKSNGLDNVEFFVGKSEDVFKSYYEKHKDMKADVVVVDPPRKGCFKTLLDTIGEVKPEKVVYVSCDCATLARDIKILGEYGYEVKKVCPVDMFPHTEHVETVVLMSKVGVEYA